MIENMKIKGTVRIQRWNKNGDLTLDTTFENLVVTSGLQWIIGRLNSPVPPVMNYIAVGTGTALPTLSDTTLETEVARQAVSVAGGSVSGQTIVYSTSYGPGVATATLTEAGIFQEATGSSMLSRVTYPAINKGVDDTVSILWTIAAQ